MAAVLATARSTGSTAHRARRRLGTGRLESVPDAGLVNRGERRISKEDAAASASNAAISNQALCILAWLSGAMEQELPEHRMSSSCVMTAQLFSAHCAICATVSARTTGDRSWHQKQGGSLERVRKLAEGPLTDSWQKALSV